MYRILLFSTLFLFFSSSVYAIEYPGTLEFGKAKQIELSDGNPIDAELVADREKEQCDDSQLAAGGA